MSADRELAADWRDIRNGWEIPSEGYCDQPYVVVADDGAWVCIMTTGAGREGQPGQHVVALRSTDEGRTWSAPVPLEPAAGPEASYAVLLKVPAGRIYAFYNHNTDNVREVKADPAFFPGGVCRRVDSLGHFVCRYSDDHGRTWSPRRYDLPLRRMAIDRENADRGALLYFWNVGRPFVLNGSAYVSLHKVGGFGEGFFTRSEGVLLRSDNILTETDPERLRWETLPEGEAGLRAPAGGGPIAEEHSYVTLSDGSIYCVYRTIDGYPACAYSRDGGRTWEAPEYQRYADGRRMKHPRAANFVWRCANGRYLYWFHNHGGRFIGEHPQRRSLAYEDRNPAWLCGGVEREGPNGRLIVWSQPEILLYDDDPFVRTSYPDLVESGGGYYVTETQKSTARVHRIPAALLEALWGQFDADQVATDGLLRDWSGVGPAVLDMPPLPPFCVRERRPPFGERNLRTGIAVEMWLLPDEAQAGAPLVDARAEDGCGLLLARGPDDTVEIRIDDGRTVACWRCDPGTITAGQPHHVVAIVDAGPRLITFVVDGVLADGGAHRQFGWGRFSPHLRSPQGASRVRIAAPVRSLRLYGRALLTSEAVGNWRAGAGQMTD